jgi:predicted AAA+ superfamily ATPase
MSDLITRDVAQLAQIERLTQLLTQLRALVRLAAARSGQLLRPAALGNEVSLPHSTISRYLELLELVFLIKRISV